jgi:hypothetical protein
MKYVLPVTVLFLAACISCKPKETVITNEYRTEHLQTLKPYVVPVESASATALLECSKEGLVLLSRLNMESSRNASLSLQLDSLGNLYVNSTLGRDTIYLPSDSVTIYRDKTVTETVEVEKQLSKWEAFLLEFGTALFWVCAGSVVLGVVMLYLKLKK